jgi:type VI secretion system protein ImpG
MNDDLMHAFLAELEALEKFRISYTGAYPSVPLAHEDPDVRRLIEAMAMLSARTRLAAERSVTESMLRLFRQHFPFLLAPVPAMALLKATCTRRLVDVIEVPRGTSVVLSMKKARGEADQVFHFQTLAHLRVLPIELVAANVIRKRSRGNRLVLEFEAAFERTDPVSDLCIAVNHLDDFASSLTVLHALRTHERGACVIFDRQVGEDTAGAPCTLTFGGHGVAPGDLDVFEHPLQRARSFFRFPHQELFLHVKQIQTPRRWQKLALCIDLDEDWPHELHPTTDSFELGVVPIANVKREMANPVECDGTRERWPVTPVDGGAGFLPHSVVGVYRIGASELEPLTPRVLGLPGDSYDAIVEGRDSARRAYLALDLSGAFEKTVRVAIDVVWHQLVPADARTTDFQVRLLEHFVEGIAFSCTGVVVPHLESHIGQDRDALLEVLSIKSQRFLGRDEVALLLAALGTQADPALARIVSAIDRLNVDERPWGRKTAGLKYVYTLRFARLERSDIPRVHLFCGKLLDVLAAWSMEEVVELIAEIPNLERTLRFE